MNHSTFEINGIKSIEYDDSEFYYKFPSDKEEEIINLIIPMSGPALTPHGEILRAAMYIAYKARNDGDTPDTNPGVARALKFIRIVGNLLQSNCLNGGATDGLEDGYTNSDYSDAARLTQKIFAAHAFLCYEQWGLQKNPFNWQDESTWINF